MTLSKEKVFKEVDKLKGGPWSGPYSSMTQREGGLLKASSTERRRASVGYNRMTVCPSKLDVRGPL